MLTLVPVLLAAWWLVRLQVGLWRRSAWRDAGGSIRAVAGLLGAPVRPAWMGWRVQGDGVRVVWAGGWRGPVTRILGRSEGRATVWVARRWLDADAVARALAAQRAGRAPDPDPAESGSPDDPR